MAVTEKTWLIGVIAVPIATVAKSALEAPKLVYRLFSTREQP